MSNRLLVVYRYLVRYG